MATMPDEMEFPNSRKILEASRIAQWRANGMSDEEIERADARLVRAFDASTPRAPDLPHVEILGCLDMASRMDDIEFVLAPTLAQGKVIALTGHPGHGKSTLGNAMAIAIALQEPFGAMRPTRQGLVYFVSAEDFDGTRLRIFAEAIRRKLTEEARALLNRNLRWAHLRGVLAPSIIREYIEEDAVCENVVAVFLDTGPAMFTGESENDNVEMQTFASGCRVLTELPGHPCVVVFWHPAKGAAADNLTPRGGSALLGAIDGNLTVWNDVDYGIVTLARSPWKWRGEHFEPLRFRLETVELVLPSGKPASIKVAVPTDETPAPRSPKTIRRNVALDALREVVREIGQRMPGTSTIPPGMRAVRLEQWRTRWALRTGYAESGPDSIRNNFNKDKDALLKAGKIAISAPYVWAY